MRGRDPKWCLMRVAAELWGRGVADVASNVDESCTKIHRSNITCSTRLRQRLNDSDDIHFIFVFMICDRSQELSPVQVWCRLKKALRIPELNVAHGIVLFPVDKKRIHGEHKYGRGNNLRRQVLSFPSIFATPSLESCCS